MSVRPPRLDVDSWFPDLSLDFRRMLAIYESVEQATQGLARERLYQHCEDPEFDEYIAATFWLSVAYMQWKRGILMPQVKVQALAIIQDGYGLTGAQTDEDRPREYRRLLGLLQSPMPPARPVRRSARPPCPLPIGSLVLVRNRGRVFAAIHVLYHSHLLRVSRWTEAVSKVYRWHHERPPTQDEFRRLEPFPERLSTCLNEHPPSGQGFGDPGMLVCIAALGRRLVPSPDTVICEELYPIWYTHTCIPRTGCCTLYWRSMAAEFLEELKYEERYLKRQQRKREKGEH
jgi:hypothetical protein